jgi:hypothetical protein
VQAFAGVADQRGQPLFDVEMHIFQVERPFKLAGFDLTGDGFHAADDVGQIAGADDALPGQHLGVGERTANVLAPHALVKIDRGRVAFDEIGNRLGEASGPSVLRGVGGHVFGLEWGS